MPIIGYMNVTSAFRVGAQPPCMKTMELSLLAKIGLMRKIP